MPLLIWIATIACILEIASGSAGTERASEREAPSQQ